VEQASADRVVLARARPYLTHQLLDQGPEVIGQVLKIFPFAEERYIVPGLLRREHDGVRRQPADDLAAAQQQRDWAAPLEIGRGEHLGRAAKRTAVSTEIHNPRVERIRED